MILLGLGRGFSTAQARQNKHPKAYFKGKTKIDETEGVRNISNILLEYENINYIL